MRDDLGARHFASDLLRRSAQRSRDGRPPCHFQSVTPRALHHDAPSSTARSAAPRERAAGIHGRARVLEALGLKAVDIIGWVSSIILVLTLGKQVRKLWQTRDSGGVSTWLFVGQLAASVGFSTYSFLLENWVFLTTNLLLVINALLGQWVTLRNRRYSRANSQQPDRQESGAQQSEA